MVGPAMPAPAPPPGEPSPPPTPQPSLAARLAELLDALANPTRIAILKELTSAKPLHRIRVPVGEEEARPLSRQAVRQHLERLTGAGFVHVVTDDDAASPEYVVNHARLFAVGEEVQGLAALRPDEEVEALQTQPAPGAAEARGEGPRLVLVRGLRPGVVFPLRRGAAAGGSSRCIVGRRRGLDVSLDYDPFVSAENAVVAFDPASATWSVEDVPGSRNGTSLNFRPLGSGVRAPLRHGDLVGVGRSVLVFWDR